MFLPVGEIKMNIMTRTAHCDSNRPSGLGRQQFGNTLREFILPVIRRAVASNVLRARAWRDALRLMN